MISILLTAAVIARRAGALPVDPVKMIMWRTLGASPSARREPREGAARGSGARERREGAARPTAYFVMARSWVSPAASA
jgi:hypothetical protein